MKINGNDGYLALLKGEQGEQGIQGKQGIQGIQGEKGDKGDKGDTGAPNVLTIGTVAKGDTASATITGNSPNQTLNLVLPKGDKGDTGAKGDKGDKGDTGAAGKDGAGCYINGVATNVNFTSDPQTQLDAKANADLSNVTYPQVVADGVARTGAGDRVIESKVLSGGQTWYRKWASGWKECGLIVSGSNGTVYLPISFTDTNYLVNISVYANIENMVTCFAKPYTANRIYKGARYQGGAAGEDVSIYCCGY